MLFRIAHRRSNVKVTLGTGVPIPPPTQNGPTFRIFAMGSLHVLMSNVCAQLLREFEFLISIENFPEICLDDAGNGCRKFASMREEI